MQFPGGKFLESCRDGICIPAFEKYQIPGLFRCGVLFKGKVHMVLFRHLGKSLDIFLGNLDIGKSRILSGKLFQRLLAVVDLASMLSLLIWDSPARV